MPSIILVGAAGRMGARLAQLIERSEDLTLAGAVERAGHPGLGQDFGSFLHLNECGIPLEDELFREAGNDTVLVDFSTPYAGMEWLNRAADRGIPAVSGTTGMSDQHLEKLKLLAQRIPIVYSPNMSVGVNLLLNLLPRIHAILPPGFDIEILETHHRFKTDSPSGTALALADAINAPNNTNRCFGRHGITGPRKEGEICIHAVRGGGIVGEHEIRFLSEQEEISLKHRALNRDVFAEGALLAVRWIVRQAPGLYSMRDVLDID